MELRPFTAADAPEALALCRELHDASLFRYLTFSEERVLKLFSRALAFPNEHFFWVAINNGTLVASFYGDLQPYFAHEGCLAADKGVYARPGHRGSGAATALVRQFIAWAREQGALEVVISTTTGIDPERTVRWLEHLGFTRVGAITKLRLEG